LKAVLFHKHTSDNHVEYKNAGSLKLNLLFLQENVSCFSEVRATDLLDIEYITVSVYLCLLTSDFFAISITKTTPTTRWPLFYVILCHELSFLGG